MIASFLYILIFAIVTFLLPRSASASSRLSLPGWEPNVKRAVNDLLALYGHGGKLRGDCRPYAVMDFDNTTSILDVGRQTYWYMLENLRLAIPPERMYDILTTGIPNPEERMGESQQYLSVGSVARDITKAYERLCAAGYVRRYGCAPEKKKEFAATADWKEFTSKVWWLRDSIVRFYSTKIGYSWSYCLFDGMTKEDVYNLALDCLRHYDDLLKGGNFEFSKMTVESPKEAKSESGVLSCIRNDGITVSPEMRELLCCFEENGIDVWICSSSYKEVITAAIDFWGLRGIAGILSASNKTKNGIIVNEYDDGKHPVTDAKGKIYAIENLIRPQYGGKGPIFTAGDSLGDFNFQTEYKDTAVSLIVNRVRHDDEALISVCAYRQNELGVTVEDAMKNGDTRFVLQGRDEAKAKFRPETNSYVLLTGLERSFSAIAKEWLELMRNGKSVREMINDCAALTGRQKNYVGYKKR